MEKGISKIEGRVMAAAFVVAAIHIGFLVFAAIHFGITVPSCVTNVPPFEKGAFIPQGPNRYEIHVVAKMWDFEPNTIQVPKGSTVDIYLTSKDVTHGFLIAKTNVNLMAVPKVVNYAQVRFKQAGKYPIVCHEYCGTGHQGMRGMIEVTESNEPGKAVLPDAGAAVAEAPGHVLVAAKGCLACHSIDGSKGIGPTFKGLWGRHEVLTDGSGQDVDLAYLRESIRNPQKKVVKGFGPVMPVLPMTDAETDQIIDYLKTVK